MRRHPTQIKQLLRLETSAEQSGNSSLPVFSIFEFEFEQDFDQFRYPVDAPQLRSFD